MPSFDNLLFNANHTTNKHNGTLARRFAFYSLLVNNFPIKAPSAVAERRDITSNNCQRPDCTFVFLPHDCLYLTTAHRLQIIMSRNCRYLHCTFIKNNVCRQLDDNDGSAYRMTENPLTRTHTKRIAQVH